MARLDLGSIATLLFFVSGAAALIYELGFIRAFVELYGSTSAALGAVIGSFLVCLMLGALAIAPRADRTSRPLRLYAILELIAALGGIVGWWWCGRLEPVASALSERSIAGQSVAWIRWGIALAMMLVPIGALGGTLPVLARFRNQERRRSVAAGGLQVANTLGAVAGVLAAALWLLPNLGVAATIAVAAAMNLVLAIVSGMLSRRASPVAFPNASDVREPAALGDQARAADDQTNATDDQVDAGEGEISAEVRAVPFLLAACLSGAFLIALEVLLFRGLAQATRGGLDTIGVLLASFLVAQAVGSGIGTVLARNAQRARFGFVLGHVLAVVGALIGLYAMYQVGSSEPWPLFRAGHVARSFEGRLWRESLMTLATVGPAACFAAIAFPCVCQLRPRSRMGFGRWVALQMAFWTAGAAIAGVLVPSYVFTTIGLRWGVLACAGLPILSLLLVTLSGGSRVWNRARVGVTLAGAAAGAVILFTPAGDLSLVRDPLQFFRAGAAPGTELLAYGEGESANVAVVQMPGGDRLLKVNNHFALGGTGVGRVEGMQAIVPAILSGSVQKALVLGVGAGVTVGTLRELGVAQVDAVELLPQVVRSLAFFEGRNGGLLRQLGRGVDVITADARTFVRSAPAESYDLIIGDLYFPWLAEAGFLYTRSHFERIQRLLKPGGVFCQWLPGHQLRWEEIGAIGRTFSDVFRGTTLWLAKPEFAFPVLGLVAGKERMKIDVRELERRIAEHPRQDLLARFGVADPQRFFSLYVAESFFFRDAFQRQDLNTTDRPWIEFSSARRVESDQVLALHNREQLYRYHEDVVGVMTTAGMDPSERVALSQRLDRSAKLDWEVFFAVTLRLAASANRALPIELRQNDPEELELAAFQRLGVVLTEDPKHELVLKLLLDQLKGRLALREYGHVRQAATDLLAAEELAGRSRILNLRGMAQLLEACRQDGEQNQRSRLEQAAADFRQALDLDAKLIEAAVNLGIALFLLEKDESAIAYLQDARQQIIVPGRAEGRLPTVAESIYLHLGGETEDARNLLARAPSQLPYLAAVARRMQLSGRTP